MLVHSYRDGIKNMEKMYGLGVRILLKMYLFLLYWTPVLGMINYLNDLFLEDKFREFQKYTDSLFGFNISFNTEFFMIIQGHASIMGFGYAYTYFSLWFS